MSEREKALERVVDKLLEIGSWYPTAIELDADDGAGPNGYELEREAKAAFGE